MAEVELTPEENQKKRILDFQEEHKLIIHPRVPIDRHVKRILDNDGHCPCDPNRPACPCEQALKEVQTETRCVCTFFVSEDYLRHWGYIPKQRP